MSVDPVAQAEQAMRQPTPDEWWRAIVPRLVRRVAEVIVERDESRAALSAITAELETAKEGRDFWVKEANHYHVGRNEALAREARVRALVEKWRGMMVGLVSPGINTPGRQACLQELEAALAAQSEEE